MPHPLTLIQFQHRCNACGEMYAVTLYEVLQEKQLEREWQSARPSRGCHTNFDALLDAIPAEHLADLDRAWERLISSLPPGIELEPL